MKKLLIIGGGSMGYAIACGITAKNLYKKSNILLVEKIKKRISFLQKKGYKVFRNINDINNKFNFDAIILAVKPQDTASTVSEFKRFPKNTILISIAAGIKLNKLSGLLPAKYAIARVMPNTPCQIAQGMSILTFNRHATKKQKIITQKIFSTIGKTLELREKYFDLIGSVVGSGPAYFCYLIEAMINTTIKEGLNKKISSKLVLQTALGTMLLLNKKNLAPEALRASVTSPKGITEQALNVFNKYKLNDIIYKGILAAKKRSIELGKGK